MTLQSYSADQSNLRWQTYFDGNEKDKDVIAATMSFNWNKRKRLSDVDIAITHHDEFKKLIMIVEKLIDHCERATNARDKVYKIYSNS